MLAYFTMTPIGALRLGILRAGDLTGAFTMSIREDTYPMSLAENQIGYSPDNPPYERATDSALVNWVVTRHGIFYTAAYYGWA